MAKKIIKISVNDEYVVGSGVVIGAEGSDEAVALQVSFNDTWAGLNIYATFRDALGENPTAVMLMPSRLVLGENMTYQIDVPKTATAIAGKMSVVFSGFAVTEYSVYNAEENAYNKLVCRDALINTGNAYFRVLPSDFSVLDTEDKPEATLFESVLAEINALHGAIEEYEKTIEEQFDAHEEAVAATIGNLGTYENESGELIPYTVEGKLGAQDEKLAAQDEKVAAQDEKVDEVYTAYKNGELKGAKGDQGEQGIQGEKGDPGKPFTVSKVYNSFAEMNDDFDTDAVEEGGFVVIETGNVEDEDNAKLYVKGSENYIYITDLSGAQGIQGPKGDPYKLTDRDRDDIAGVVYEKHFGDIGAALDEIILVQNTLMGKKISFTIKSRDDGVKTYEAIDGMTWGQWIKSEYNTIGATSGNMVGDYVGSVYQGIRGVYLNGDIACVTDVIVADAEYYFL